MRTCALLLAVLLGLGGGCSDDSTPSDSGPPTEGGAEAGSDAGDDGGIGNDVTPEKLLGGGTGGGAIDGRLNVYVLDSADDAPLEGALVMLGDGAVDQATTDKDGLVTFRRPGLDGPVTVTAGLTGYTTSTVAGLDAANFTVTLGSRSPAATVKTGTCSGTVKDWDQLPTLPQDHVYLGFAGYLLTKDLGDAENEVKQPPGDLNLYAPTLNKKTWTLKVPAKDGLGVYVVVLDVDTKGTSDSGDDEHTLTHVGMLRDLKVGEGQILANIQLSVAVVDDTLKVNLPAQLPAGTDETGVGVLVQHASGDLLPIFFNNPSTGEFPVPKLAGDFAGGNYWVIVAAEPTGEPESERQTESLVLKRNITDTTKAVDVTLLELPSAIKLDGRKISFSAPTGMQLQTATLYPQSAGAAYWSVALIDQSAPTSFDLPTLPQGAKAEDLPTGKLLLHVNVMELQGVDLNNARFNELTNNLTRSSKTGVVVELK